MKTMAKKSILREIDRYVENFHKMEIEFNEIITCFTSFSSAE